MDSKSIARKLTFQFNFTNILAVVKFYSISILPIIFLESDNSFSLLASKYMVLTLFCSIIYLGGLYLNNHWILQRIVPAIKNLHLHLNEVHLVGQLEKISYFNFSIYTKLQAQPTGIFPYKISIANEPTIYLLLPYNISNGTKCYVIKVPIKNVFGKVKQQKIIMPIDFLDIDHTQNAA